MGVAVVAALGAAMAIGVGGLVLGPRLVRVPSRSMAPTIESGGYVLLRTAVGTIERGDVVAFPDNRRDAADSRFIGAIERDSIWGKRVHW